MPIKTHLIKTYDMTNRDGETACGEPFFQGATYFGPGSFQSYRRIGGLRAVDADDFDAVQFDRHTCVKCRNVRWNQ